MITRLALLPAIAAGLAAATVVAAPAAHASVLHGNWSSPSAGATVSGVVQLSFSSGSSTAVTFVVPGAQLQATVTAGTATASWDTRSASDQAYPITAHECDPSGCDDVTEQVNVNNPVTTGTLPFTPATGAALKPGSTVTVGSSGTAVVDVVTDGVDTELGNQALPFRYTVPALAQGTHQLEVVAAQGAAYSQASYVVTVARTTAPVITSLAWPKSFFPIKDGYEDTFPVTVSADEAATAHLYILKGKKVVAKGVAHVTGYGTTTVSAGAGLKPGKYTWYLALQDSAKRTRKSATKSVTADGRHIVKHVVTEQLAPSTQKWVDASGDCGAATAAGDGVAISSQATCDDPDEDFGAAGFQLGLPATVDKVPSFALSVTTSGSQAAAVIVKATSDDSDPTEEQGGAIEPGTTTITVPVDQLSTGRQLLLLVGVVDGSSATVTHLKITYTYATFGK